MRDKIKLCCALRECGVLMHACETQKQTGLFGNLFFKYTFMYGVYYISLFLALAHSFIFDKRDELK